VCPGVDRRSSKKGGKRGNPGHNQAIENEKKKGKILLRWGRLGQMKKPPVEPRGRGTGKRGVGANEKEKTGEARAAWSKNKGSERELCEKPHGNVQEPGV